MFFWISTAVACRAGNTCTMYCWMEDPSLEAKYLSSARAARKPKAAKTLGSFLIMSVALCIRSSFSSTATANGSFSNVEIGRAHVCSSDLGAGCQEAEGREDLGVLLDNERGVVHQIQFFIHRHGERIFLERRRPAVGVCLGGSKLDRAGLQRRVGLRHHHGLARDARDFLGGHQRRSREPPLTLGDDPHAEAEVLLIGDERNFVGFVSAAVRRKAV